MTYDAIVVLGDGIKQNGALLDSGAESVSVASKLFHQGSAPKILFSGKWSRHSEFIPASTEAAAMRDLAVSLGVPTEDILIEEESLDTISNLYFLKTKLLSATGWSKFLFVVSKPREDRLSFLAQNILGPDFTCDMHTFGNEFPDKLGTLEKEKLERLQNFFSEHSIAPGDHERIFKLHLDYVEKHKQS